MRAAIRCLSNSIQMLAAKSLKHSTSNLAKYYTRRTWESSRLITMLWLSPRSFLKMIASGPDVSVVSLSPQFTLTGITGRDNGAFQDLRKRQAVGAYTIPYHLQTGPTRYAPMAKKPGSTIPAKSPTPQFPTSAYSVATAYLPAPTVQATMSADRTYSVVSIENTVCEA